MYFHCQAVSFVKHLSVVQFCANIWIIQNIFPKHGPMENTKYTKHTQYNSAQCLQMAMKIDNVYLNFPFIWSNHPLQEKAGNCEHQPLHSHGITSGKLVGICTLTDAVNLFHMLWSQVAADCLRPVLDRVCLICTKFEDSKLGRLGNHVCSIESEILKTR